ncbi:MAG: protein kinase, partial [Anaerolineae bacterium]|nr:protein kinase [Anaerolineae bacterium]
MIISNRYRLIEKLGQGGVGVVFRAADRLSGDFVALKQLRVAVADLDFATRQAATGLLDKNLALAFEFRTLAGLRHPNVVSVLDYGFDQEHQPFFTMQLIEDASTILEYGQRASLDVKVRLLVEMLQALTYLHRRDIIHRDLKPSNVLISASGTLKMMDFGLAVSHSQTISTGQTGIAGTLAYMAPEMFEGENASIQSDLFAIGIISYELFAGRYPFDSKSTAMLLHSIINSTVDTTMLEPKLAAVVDKLLAKTAAGRYTSAPAVIDALLEATDQPRPQESISIRESYLQASEFVGRQQELETLKAALEDMLSDPPRGSAWLIGGESGVGKSRLVDELRIRALTRGALVLRGQGVAGGGLPYQLWRGPLRRLVLHTEPGKTDAAVLKDLVPDIGTLLAYDVPDAVTLEGRESQQRLVGAIVSMFQRIQQPVVLILEDLQWALDSLEPLKSLSNILHDLPLLIVANYRDDESPELPDLLNNLRALKLERLGDQAIEELSASMLGSIGKRIDLIELLKRETEGNVFFIVEVVRMLAEEAGGLDDIGRKSLPDRVFAGGMKEVIQRRLRRVPEWGQELLKLSAVAGREVDLKLLAHWTADFEPWLTICANAAVLEVREGRWRFAHDKLREALIAELSPEERPHLHEQIATAIEAVYPHGDTWAVVLLEHWRQAGDPQREIEYALAAVNVLWSTSSLREAAEIAARTLPKIPDDSTRAVMLRQLGEVHFGLGNIEEASEIFQQSMALARTIDDRLTIALCL